jgi:hypothetical protein
MENKTEQIYKRFCKKRFQLPSIDEIKECEQFLQITFSARIRSYLGCFNGGLFTEPTLPGLKMDTGDRLNVMYGIKAELSYCELMSPLNVSLFENELERLYLPIGYTLMGGLLLLCLDSDDAEQIFLEPASGKRLFFLAKNIEEFFFGLQANPTNHKHLLI